MLKVSELKELRDAFGWAVVDAKVGAGFEDAEPNDNIPDDATDEQSEVSSALYHCQEINMSSNALLALLERNADVKGYVNLFAAMAGKWKEGAEQYKKSTNPKIVTFVQRAEDMLDYVASAASSGP